MLMERIGELGGSGFVIVRLLRRWVAARDSGLDPLPSLIGLANELGQPPQLAIALHSLLQLTESCLGRPLVAECCCNPSAGPDERAVLLTIAVAPAPGLPIASRDIPHGLPGALSWVAASVRCALGRAQTGCQAPPVRCPFRKISDTAPPAEQ